jgi:hypothetical protein
MTTKQKMKEILFHKWPLTLKKEHKLPLSENKLLKKPFKPKMSEADPSLCE